MSRAPVDQYERLTKDNQKGVAFCGCGKAVGARGHNGRLCSWWRHSSPSPGRGQLPAWMAPLRLYSSHADDDGEATYLAPEFERYLSFWVGRYQIALERLADRSPDWYRTYVAVLHEDRPVAELAMQWKVPHKTIWTWKRRAVEWMRDSVRDAYTWERAVAPGLAVEHDPTAAGYAALIAELTRSNARIVA